MASSVHRGDYQRMRRGITIALIEVEAMEPRLLAAYARGEIPDQMVANLELVKLLLDRADQVTRKTLDRLIASHYEIYADATFTDRLLAESA